MSICNNFIDAPLNAYRPLACKPIIVTTRTLGGTGRQNKAELFFITKPNTLRENATLELLYEIPLWLRRANTPNDATFARRATRSGFRRVTVDGDERVVTHEIDLSLVDNVN